MVSGITGVNHQNNCFIYNNNNHNDFDTLHIAGNVRLT